MLASGVEEGWADGGGGGVGEEEIKSMVSPVQVHQQGAGGGHTGRQTVKTGDRDGRPAARAKAKVPTTYLGTLPRTCISGHLSLGTGAGNLGPRGSIIGAKVV